MKKHAFLLLWVATAILLVGGVIARGSGASDSQKLWVDSVTVTDQSTLYATSSAGSDRPDRIHLRVNIRYELFSADAGTVALALNDKGEMNFSTFNSAKVTRGQGEIDLKAEVRMLESDTLRCVVMLTNPHPAPGEKPLALATVSVNLKELRATRQRR